MNNLYHVVTWYDDNDGDTHTFRYNVLAESEEAAIATVLTIDTDFKQEYTLAELVRFRKDHPYYFLNYTYTPKVSE